MSIAKFVALFAVCSLPAAALAAGAHDSLGCNGCHSIHNAKGDFIFEVTANKTAKNAKGQTVGGSSALCLGCHAKKEQGGQDMAPVAAHASHPYGLDSVNPKVASVPAEGLRNGKFECTGCHDPHPSNPNFAYLRVDTNKGKNMDKFCAACHSVKADRANVQSVAFFSSMDQRVTPAATAAAPAAPAKK